jgi:two-component system phosphate regulon response regulator PhoB
MVLVVDDDDDLRCVILDVLEEAGFDAIGCGDIATVLALLDGLVPQVVLLDRDLPDGSGLDFARWMRRRPLYDGVRIIGFSARTTPLEVDASLAAGCDAFVGKPCAPAALLREIHAASDRRRARSGLRRALRIPTPES